MGYVHDTGFDPAYDHEGWTSTVLDDGSDTGSWPIRSGREVVGWRAACACGWRGATWSRGEWPSDNVGDTNRRLAGEPPEAVEDGCYPEWAAHLYDVLPELAVHDAALALAAARANLDTSVIEARVSGCSWERVGAAAGMSRQSAYERWESMVRSATAPIPLDNERLPAHQLDSFGADVARRCQLARRRHGGHPPAAWSTSERLAVALVLRDWEHLTDMGYTKRDAQDRVSGGMRNPPSDFSAWLDGIRVQVNSAASRLGETGAARQHALLRFLRDVEDHA